jgi:acyl-CoA thioesterase FadM
MLDAEFHHEKSRQLLAPKTFRHSIHTYLKDSNAYQNNYFARYFEWQGIFREHWFKHRISNDMLQSRGALATRRAHNSFVKETFPFQTIECALNTASVRKCSFFLVFRFYVDDQFVSIGYQEIAFTDFDKKLIGLPDDVLQKIRQYEIMSY